MTTQLPKIMITSIIMLLFAGGCGGPGGAEIGSVTGKVTLDGKPLAAAQVLFQPLKGRGSAGETDENGVYVLKYVDLREGAVPGKHRVEISTYREGEEASEDASGTEAAPELIPVNYNSESELESEVQAGTNTFDFELTSDAGEIIQPDADDGSEGEDEDEE